MTRAPSGEQFEIAHAGQRATVVEVGGGLREYRAGDRELLDGYPLGEMSSSGRGQLLIPWPNRIEDGSYEFRGVTHQLPLDDVPERDAIHGLVRWATWTVAEREPHRVLMAHRLHPRPGYPFALDLSVEYLLSDGGLQVQTSATNAGAEAAPYGCGAHPYLRLGSETVDSLLLRLPAQTVLHSDERGIPVNSSPVDGTECDFRSTRPIGATRLDHAFTDLLRDADGRARVTLHDPGSGADLELWVDESHSQLMVFTGDPVPSVNRRSIAIEPMTCPPNSFRSGAHLVVLKPGESFTSRWGIDPPA
jgi:aldose 1-epimerase